jgi:hypothetical protein
MVGTRGDEDELSFVPAYVSSAGSSLTAQLSLRGYVVNNGPLNGIRQPIRKLHTPTLTCWGLGILNGDILGIHARPAASHEQPFDGFVRGPRVASLASVASCPDCARFSASDLLHWGFPSRRTLPARVAYRWSGRWPLCPISLVSYYFNYFNYFLLNFIPGSPKLEFDLLRKGL